MEFEKLQEIIVDVLNVNPDEITMDTTFVDDSSRFTGYFPDHYGD